MKQELNIPSLSSVSESYHYLEHQDLSLCQAKNNNDKKKTKQRDNNQISICLYDFIGWATSLSLFTFMHWKRKWQPTPVFLPGESQGQRSLVGCRLWGRTESDTTEAT